MLPQEFKEILASAKYSRPRRALQSTVLKNGHIENSHKNIVNESSNLSRATIAPWTGRGLNSRKLTHATLGYLPIWEEKGLILKFGDYDQRYRQKVSMNVKLSA